MCRRTQKGIRPFQHTFDCFSKQDFRRNSICLRTHMMVSYFIFTQFEYVYNIKLKKESKIYNNFIIFSFSCLLEANMVAYNFRSFVHSRMRNI